MGKPTLHSLHTPTPPHHLLLAIPYLLPNALGEAIIVAAMHCTLHAKEELVDLTATESRCRFSDPL